MDDVPENASGYREPERFEWWVNAVGGGGAVCRLLPLARIECFGRDRAPEGEDHRDRRDDAGRQIVATDRSLTSDWRSVLMPAPACSGDAAGTGCTSAAMSLSL